MREIDITLITRHMIDGRLFGVTTSEILIGGDGVSHLMSESFSEDSFGDGVEGATPHQPHGTRHDGSTPHHARHVEHRHPEGTTPHEHHARHAEHDEVTTPHHEHPHHEGAALADHSHKQRAKHVADHVKAHGDTPLPPHRPPTATPPMPPKRDASVDAKSEMPKDVSGKTPGTTTGESSTPRSEGATPSNYEQIRGNANNAERLGMKVGKDLTRITTSSGKTATVNKQAAESFRGFVNDLEASGYKVDSLGGYNPRKKRGGSGWSQHAYGNAIDINPASNPFQHGLKTDLPSNVSEMAARHGLSWGGDWSGKKDPMHFEYTGLGPVGSSATPSNVSAERGQRSPAPPESVAGGKYNLGNIKNTPADVRRGAPAFKSYGTERQAANAIVRTLSGYPKRFGTDTLSGMMKHYAPASDRNNPVQYAQNLNKWTGLPLDQPLDFKDPETKAKIAYGISRGEGRLGGRTLDTFRQLFTPGQKRLMSRSENADIGDTAER